MLYIWAEIEIFLIEHSFISKFSWEDCKKCSFIILFICLWRYPLPFFLLFPKLLRSMLQCCASHATISILMICISDILANEPPWYPFPALPSVPVFTQSLYQWISRLHYDTIWRLIYVIRCRFDVGLQHQLLLPIYATTFNARPLSRVPRMSASPKNTPVRTDWCLSISPRHFAGR